MKIKAATRLKAGRDPYCGAGVLLYAQDTGRFLLVRRSPHCDYPGTWCGVGGGVEPHEEPMDAIRREAQEEVRYPEGAPCDLHHVGSYKDDDFEFHNYLGIIPTEFEPCLNDEHTHHQWCRWEDFPEDMHPNMMEVFNSNMGQTALGQHTTAFE
jgi:8-oxo-dGTP pyrophosphatase MutT (NUDIX family)